MAYTSASHTSRLILLITLATTKQIIIFAATCTLIVIAATLPLAYAKISSIDELAELPLKDKFTARLALPALISLHGAGLVTGTCLDLFILITLTDTHVVLGFIHAGI